MSSNRPSRQTRRPVFLDAYDVNDEENSRPVRSVSNRRGRIVRRRISPEFENILYTPNLNSNINRPEIFNLANEVNDIINNQRNRIPTTLSMPEPTLRERANEKGLQHESAKKYRLSLAANMYLHARNVDVHTFSEINIMKFNGGLMTDICIFCKSYFFSSERNTSGIFNLCCSGENVKLSNFVAPTPLMNELFKGSTPHLKYV